MAGNVGVNWTQMPLYSCFGRRVDTEWQTGLMIPLWKMKGDVHT